jgi:hypothetical protein
VLQASSNDRFRSYQSVRSKHILQHLIVISVNMGVLLWYVVIYICCMVRSSFSASLVSIITIILVLRSPTYDPWRPLTVLSVQFHVKPNSLVSLCPQFILSKCKSKNSFIHFCGANSFMASICQFSVGNVCIFPSSFVMLIVTTSV